MNKELKNTKKQIKRPTSQDVADRAAVSRATVSYVLNNTPNTRISAETRNKVLKAVQELGYIPHQAAQSLRASKSDLIVLPFFDWPYNRDSIGFLQIIARHFDERGYTVIMRYLGNSRGDELIQKIASLHPAGVLFTTEEFTEEDVIRLRNSGIRGLLALNYGETKYWDVPSINVDFIALGRLVGERFKQKGHTSVAVILPVDKRIRSLGFKRLEGIKQICIPSDIEVLTIDMEYTADSAKNTAKLLHAPGQPTAVFSYNDEYGALLLTALQREGVSIPEEISVIGCDNLPICDILTPRLTSVSMGSDSSIEEVAEVLEKMIENPDITSVSQHFTASQLIVRESG